MTYVLLPGAGGDPWYWHRVVPLLEARGHEVLTPRLPAADPAAGLADYADTVVAAIGDRTGIVLVAQSMAGFVAPLVCARVPVAEIVLVAAMIPAPGETGGAWWTTSGQEAAQRAADLREGRDPDAPFDVGTLFFHDVPPEVVAAAMAAEAPEQSDRPFEDPFPLDGWPDVPTRVIACRHDRLFPLEFMRSLARARLGRDVDAVVDSGHLPALAAPEELVAAIAA